MTETTLERCRTAIADVWERYRIVERGDGCWVRLRPESQKEPVFAGAHDECQAWIDREAARACIGALLPVSEQVVKVIRSAQPQDDLSGLEARLNSLAENQFTAAITAVLEGRG